MGKQDSLKSYCISILCTERKKAVFFWACRVVYLVRVSIPVPQVLVECEEKTLYKVG